MTNIITVENLKKSYNSKTVVDDLSLIQFPVRSVE